MRLIWALFACAAPDATAFAHARAGAICAWHARCGTLEAAGFPSEGACQEALIAAADALGEEGGLACDGHDPRAEAACLATWEHTRCGEPLDLQPCEALCDDP